MSEVGNLGGESVGSTENSQACYLGVRTHAPHPFLSPKNSRSFQAIVSTIFFLVTKINYVATGIFTSK